MRGLDGGGRRAVRILYLRQGVLYIPPELLYFFPLGVDHLAQLMNLLLVMRQGRLDGDDFIVGHEKSVA